MIETAVLINGWPDTDWGELAHRAVQTAFAISPFAALIHVKIPVEIAIRLDTDTGVQTLNRDYRHKNVPTNVLSFPMLDTVELMSLMRHHSNDDTDEAAEILLGDIILGYDTCAREAIAKKITLADHATHLIIHGTLHLLGYDHVEDDQAQAMESCERLAMAALGLHNPYRDDDGDNLDSHG